MFAISHVLTPLGEHFSIYLIITGSKKWYNRLQIVVEEGLDMKIYRSPQLPDIATQIRKELRRELGYHKNHREASLNEIDFAEKIRQEERKVRTHQAQIKRRGPHLQQVVEELLKTVS